MRRPGRLGAGVAARRDRRGAAALVAAATGMVIATGVWVALTVALDKAGLLR